jgi:molybdopterin-guanine dinucleotide biosynthesis protein A
MKLAAVIVAGGRSSRMGQEKAFAEIGGRHILARIIERLAPQVTLVAINANGPAGRFSGTGCPIVADRPGGVATPLAGLHAALQFAVDRRFDFVLTVPSDTPFLPRDLVMRLAAADSPAAIAASGGQAHYLTGLWAASLLGEAAAALGMAHVPRMQDWVERARAVVVDWPVEPYDPFFNVNTPDDLAEAGRIAAEFQT